MKRMLDAILENESITMSKEYALAFEPERIEFEVMSGHTYQGSFHIIVDDKAETSGYVYSTDLRMVVRTREFQGLTREILFTYDATGLKDGSQQQGKLQIVSNLGEYELAYSIRITNNILECQLGEIRNLFHYANLAMTEWSEAVDLFYSDSFETILTGNDREYLEYYRGLSKCLPDENGDYVIGNESNVDRFLEVSKKKTRVTFSTQVKSIEIKDPEESIIKEIPVKREGWGFSYLEVEIDGSFINSEVSNILTENFDGDIFMLPVSIDYDKLHAGINYGKLVLSNFFQRIEISVRVSLGAIPRYEREQKEAYQLRNFRISLMRLYIDYRLGRINKQEWSRKNVVAVSAMLASNPENLEYKLYHAHLLNVQKREEESRQEIALIEALMDADTSEVLKGYSLYIQYLNTKDDEEKQRLAHSLELIYVQNPGDFRLSWFLMYMKEELIEDSYERWDLVKRLYERGCSSPLLFLEALTVCLKTQAVMNEIGSFEMAFMKFAIRRDVTTREVRDRFVYLARNTSVYSEDIYKILVFCYEKSPSDEILEQICNMLMRGNRIGEDCFKWYERAVEHEIRINRLYEYYMMSIDLGYQGRLPKLVLMYFAYKSNLDYERSAFLYANVLKHRPAYSDIYDNYMPIIESFAREQLSYHRLNDNLAYIYKTILGDALLQEPYVESYALLLFMYRMTISVDGIDAVIVVDQRLAEEKRFPVYGNEVVVTLMDDKQYILLEDEYGNRYADKNLYQLRRIIRTEAHIDEVMERAGLTLMPALYLAEKAVETSGINDKNENALLFISDCQEITENYRLEIMMRLAEYYFDKDDIAKLDELLLRFEPSSLDAKMREQCIRIMVSRGMYDRALEWLENYGCEYIDDRILVRLCDRVLVRSDYEYDPDILNICEGIFERGRYDETILTYLLLYKKGSTKGLKTLWRATDSFNLDAHSLLENMIIQILFTGQVVGEEGNIFLEYVSGGSNQQLESRFLDLLAYRYFVKNENISEEVFDRCIYLNQMGEQISDYAKLAYLKKCEQLIKEDKLEAEQKALSLLFIKEFTGRHMFIPFFLSFKALWPKLAFYEDRRYIEYRGMENSRVVLHYVIEHAGEAEEEYKKQEMTHVIGGIYVHSFVLFYGERVRYYITEEGARSEKLTTASVLDVSEADNAKNDGRYESINNLAISHVMKDDNTFLELSREYAEKVFLVDSLFKGI